MNFKTVNKLNTYIGKLCWVKDHAHGFVPRTIENYVLLSDNTVKFKLSSKFMIHEDMLFTDSMIIHELQHHRQMFIHPKLVSANTDENKLFEIDHEGRVYPTDLIDNYDIELKVIS